MNMISNIAAPAEFIDRITSELETITKSWSRIGSALSEAEEVFGYDSDAFKQILKATKFSRGTATKLVKIARSERLRQHATLFSKCQAWTTLYEVTTLSEEQFAELLASIGMDEVVTFGMVRKVKAITKEADPYKVAFTVRIDDNALRGGLVDETEFARLLELIAQIQDTVPFIRVDCVDRIDEQNSRYAYDLQLEYERLMRSHLSVAIKECKQRSSEWKSYKPKKGLLPPLLGPYSNADEACISFNVNPRAVLSALDYDGYDEHKTWKSAEDAVNRKYQRFTNRANQPFRHANNIVSTSADYDDGCAVVAA